MKCAVLVFVILAICSVVLARSPPRPDGPRPRPDGPPPGVAICPPGPGGDDVLDIVTHAAIGDIRPFNALVQTDDLLDIVTHAPIGNIQPFGLTVNSLN